MRRYMSKRQRPCDFCRSRKTACRIDHAPPCRACVLSRRECTFVQDAPSRKRPAEGQDPASSEGMSTTAGGDHSPSDEPGLHHSDAAYASFFSDQDHGQDHSVQHMLYHDPEGLTAAALDMDMDVSNYPFMTTSMSPFGSQEAAQVSMINHEDVLGTGGSPLQTLDQMEDGCPQVIGLSSDMDPYLIHRYKSDDSGYFHFKQLSIQSVQAHPYPVQFLTSKRTLVAKTREDTADTEVSDTQLRAELEAVVSASIGRRLLTLFDTHVAPQYPIFSTEAPPDPESSPVHLLAAAYAVAFPFSMYDEKLCIDLAYDAPPYADLSRLINFSLRPDIHSPTLSVAQTLVLLLIRPLANPLVAETAYKSSLMGCLASVAITLGLHLDAGSWNIPTWQIALRRRLSFTIYCLDKWMAASLGRPKQLRDDDWIVTSVVEASDRTGTNLTDSQWDYLEFMSELTGVLDTTLSRLFSLRASQQIVHDSRYALANVESLLQTLCSISGPQHSDSSLNILRLLGYHYVRLLIIRAVTRPPVQAANPHAMLPSGGCDPKLREMLRTTVADLLDFVKSIRTDATQVFWPPWCPIAITALCFTLLSAVVTSGDEEEAREWLDMLQSTRRELRMKATTLPVLRLGLLRIDAVFWRGLDKVLRLEPHVQAAVHSTLSS